MRTQFTVAVLVSACMAAAITSLPGCGGGTSNGASTSAVQSITPSVSVARTLPFQGSSYPYYLYVPHSYDGTRAMPSVLLIHGANGNGGDFITTWEHESEKAGLVLVAPTIPGDAGFETKSPQFLIALMEAAQKEIKIDTKRRYVFGYSNGGYDTFEAAMYDSEYFAGAGVFAGIITPSYYGIVDQAKRKNPIAIYIGDHDQFFTLTQTRQTRDLLVSHGFPVHYVEIAHQDHNYPAIEDTVNADAWSYLSNYSLP